MDTIRVKIEKLVFGGQGLGHFDGRVVLAWNALPGEEVEVEIIRKKKNYLEGVARNIISPSPDRVLTQESHFISCSPWQILSFNKENFWKKAIAKETYKKIGKFSWEGELEIVSDERAQYGYRNKMEYSFCADDNKEISLAFFERATNKLRPIEGCVLADKTLARAAEETTAWLKENSFLSGGLKTLILRSNLQGERLGALFVKDDLARLPESAPQGLRGFQIYFSRGNNPSSLPEKLLYESGEKFLEEQLLVSKLRYGALSFFQINIPLFEKALGDISLFLDSKNSVVDYYSGVGSISLPLADKFFEAVLVDNNEEAIGYAEENIKLNGRGHCRAVLSPAEKMAGFITPEKVIIFDPPRAGLHPKIAKKVLEEKPRRIIYLSCNLATQARDVGEFLRGGYELKFLRLYNFFPRTPHIEGLCVLET
ncbi:MAG: TRAM domain-containing protein [Patescibacteria group bacterium]|nr:TRAM domain-containing protein [Patescibacteria group bacterium]MDD5490801.1 TRAM domain-containing protein [Patescibacteria group bacterium]